MNVLQVHGSVMEHQTVSLVKMNNIALKVNESHTIIEHFIWYTVYTMETAILWFVFLVVFYF